VPGTVELDVSRTSPLRLARVSWAGNRNASTETPTSSGRNRRSSIRDPLLQAARQDVRSRNSAEDINVSGVRQASFTTGLKAIPIKRAALRANEKCEVYKGCELYRRRAAADFAR